jgi:hypothetical protein
MGEAIGVPAQRHSTRVVEPVQLKAMHSATRSLQCQVGRAVGLTIGEVLPLVRHESDIGTANAIVRLTACVLHGT